MLKNTYVLMLAGCCIIGCFSGCSRSENDLNVVSDNSQTETNSTVTVPVSESETTVHQSTTELTDEEKITAVYNNCLESTFCIFTSSNNNGTGFLYKGQYIITNAHILYDAEDLTIVDHKKSEHNGTVIFTDDATDIAVIQIDGYEGRSVTLGDSDTVTTGEQIVMIGNPADGEPFSFCTGSYVQLEDELKNLFNPDDRYIPVDADITSGYSGGPAFDLNGELIGINNAAYTGDLSEYEFDHLGLLIPINRVIDEIDANTL